MRERSQGAIEYLLMLAAVLTVLSTIVYLIYGTSSGLAGNVESRIGNVREVVIDMLT